MNARTYALRNWNGPSFRMFYRTRLYKRKKKFVLKYEAQHKNDITTISSKTPRNYESIVTSINLLLLCTWLE